MNARTAFVLACIADISACSAISPLDDYVTSHNLYGDLCFTKEALEARDESIIAMQSTGADVNCKDGSTQNATNEEENQEEAL